MTTTTVRIVQLGILVKLNVYILQNSIRELLTKINANILPISRSEFYKGDWFFSTQPADSNHVKCSKLKL